MSLQERDRERLNYNQKGGNGSRDSSNVTANQRMSAVPRRWKRPRDRPPGTSKKKPPCWHFDLKPCKMQVRLLASGAMRTNLHCLTPLSSLKCYSIKGTNTVTKVTPILRKWKVSIFPHRKKQTKKIPPLSIGTICCQLQTIWKYSVFPIYYNFIYRFLLILAL